jgi:magnesium-transporting ATPase (P-type)
MDEAALTGESECVKKNVTDHGKDPFLLSSTVCATHGNAEDAKAIVIGVGGFSQWGKIQANLDQEATNTPLQVPDFIPRLSCAPQLSSEPFTLLVPRTSWSAWSS